MDTGTLITIISLAGGLLISLTCLLIAFFRGDMKKFIEEKMAEAESHKDWTAEEKRNFVIKSFSEKYKIGQFILNCKKFIEVIIDISKKINYKK